MIYFVQAGERDSIKIGHAGQPLKRIASLQTARPDQLCLLGVIDGGRHEERALHDRFDHLRIRGEWFDPGDDLVDFVRRNAKVCLFEMLEDGAVREYYVPVGTCSIHEAAMLLNQLHQEARQCDGRFFYYFNSFAERFGQRAMRNQLCFEVPAVAQAG